MSASAHTSPRGPNAADRYEATAEPVDPIRWERLVSGFADAAYDQTNAYGAHLWGQRKLDHIVLRRDGAVAAAAQVLLLRTPLFGRGVAYVKFGPLWRRKDSPADPSVLTAMLEALQAEYALRRGLLLTVLPTPDPLHREQWRESLEALGFRQRRRMSDPNRYLVDVSIGREAQHCSLQQKWRYNLNKALAHGLTFHRLDDGVDTFLALYRAMVARKRFTDHSGVGALADLQATVPDAMRPRVYVGEHDGRPTVGAVIGLIGETAYYLFGATDDRALASKAGYALQWWIVGELEGAARWYDLGGEAGEPGLRQFKKGLVGKRGVVLPMLGEHDFWTNGIGRLTGDAIFAVRAARHAGRQLVRSLRPGARSGTRAGRSRISPSRGAA
jgi:hypothetical protein